MNDYFERLFHHSEVVSVHQIILTYLSGNGIVAKAARVALELFMSTTAWKKWIPSLKEYKSHKTIDFRCGFSKSFIQGKL